MKKMTAVLVLMALVGTAGAAMQFQPLSVPEAAWMGATHKAIITKADLTASTAGTTQTNSVTIPAGTAVECVGLKLLEAFDTGHAYTGSVALVVGDGSDVDLFLTSTELASDGTEVFVKYAPPHTATVTSAMQTNTVVSAVAVTLVTNSVIVAGGTTQSLVCASAVTATSGAVATVSSVTAAATVGELGRKLYAAAGDLVFTFTPNSLEALNTNTKGNVEIFFKLMQK